MENKKSNSYQNGYNEVFHKGKIGFVNRVIHNQLERLTKGHFPTTLELGSGPGQHLEHVTHSYEVYIESDIREELLRDPKSVKNNRLKTLRLDAEDLSIFSDNSVDRIVNYCLLIHLTNPEHALKEWRRVIKKKSSSAPVSQHNNQISFYVPCEPGLLLRLLRLFTVARKTRKLGYDHYSFHYKEHVSYFTRLNHIIEEVFVRDRVRKRFWPFLIPSWNLNLGVFYDIQVLGENNLENN